MVSSDDVRIEKEPLKAYNLTVSEFHTYFVKGEAESAQSVWVHNTCNINANKQLGKRTKHIDNRHVDRKKYPGKSKFKKPNQIDKINERTIKKSDRTIDQGDRVGYEKDFNREIGTRGEKTNVTVVDKKKNKRVTQFPKNTDE